MPKNEIALDVDSNKFNEEDFSSVSSSDENIKNKYAQIKIDYSIIDNLSPNWGVMLTLQENINLRIGKEKMKKYVSAGFWNYISTPINFIITLFTALSAGQTGSKSSFLTENQLFYILFVSFILSIINTFFKLKDKAILNYKSAKQFETFGAIFEEIYFKPVMHNADVKNRLLDYCKLQCDINKAIIEEDIESVNYLTDYLFSITNYIYKLKQVSIDERFWLLDGISVEDNEKYTRKYEVNMENLFIKNFNKKNIDAIKNDKQYVNIIRNNSIESDSIQSEILHQY